MRNDLAKVVTESPRFGSGHGSTKHGGRVRVVNDPEHLYEDEFGGFRSSGSRRQLHSKTLSDFLSPIEGILHKNCGRPWNDVYSEFCEFLDRSSVSGIHIFGHVMDYVKVSGIYEGEDGNVYQYQAGVNDTRFSMEYNSTTRKYFYVPNPKGTLWLACDTIYTGFYAHPRTGILTYERPRNGGSYAGNPYRDAYWRYRKPELKVIDTIALTDGSNYRLEECGRGRKRFNAWFHYHVETTMVPYRRPIKESMVESYRLSGKTVHKFPKLKERNYAFEGDEVIQMDYYIIEYQKHAKTHKRSCNRKDLQVIREHLNPIAAK